MNKSKLDEKFVVLSKFTMDLVEVYSQDSYLADRLEGLLDTFSAFKSDFHNSISLTEKSDVLDKFDQFMKRFENSLE